MSKYTSSTRLSIGSWCEPSCRDVNGSPRDIATGQIRGTPRSALIEKKGLNIDTVIEQVTQALAKAGGDPYVGYAQGILIEARAAQGKARR